MSLTDLEQILGHSFSDTGLLEKALVHSSSATDRLDSNERMEFLGDAVLGMLIVEALFLRCPERPEGELTQVKSDVVSRASCAQIASQLSLGKYVRTSKGMESQGGSVPDNVLAALFEALIGALFLDGGIEPARAFVLRVMEPLLLASLSSPHQGNYKAVLQHLAQKITGQLPHYRQVRSFGPEHDKRFEVEVLLASRICGKGIETNKRKAEQLAARQVLIASGILTSTEARDDILLEGDQAIACFTQYLNFDS